MADPYSAAGGAAAAMASVRAGATGDSPDVGRDSRAVYDAFAPDQPLSAGQVLRRLAPYLASSRWMLAGALVASVATTLAQLAVPILIGGIIDLMVGSGEVDLEALVAPLRTLALVTLCASGAQWACSYALTQLSAQVVLRLRLDAHRKLSSLPLSRIDAHPHGDLLARIAVDVDAVGDGILQGLTQLLTGIVAIVGTLAFMTAISVPVTVVVVILTPLSVVAAWAIAHFSASSFASQQALAGSLSGYAEEMITNQALLTAFARERSSVEAFDAINEELRGVGERAQFVSSLANPTTRLVNGIIYAVVAVIGCVGVVTGRPSVLTVGQVQSLLSYANKYMAPFNQISAVVTQVQAAFASARRVFALLDVPDESPDDAQDASPTSLPQPVAGKLDFDHVAFSYDPSHPLLSDISFHAHPGQKFALVGPTGCGKTTLINLLLRFYEPDGGTIRVDGVDIRTLSRAELRGAFGMVLQDTWLFEGTVADNIAYGRPDATREEVERAACRAHADRFIRQLPDGYDTLVSEDGGTLSAGQRQLLCIARVMLADPPILLLDEATSSIDTRTEREVADAFDRMMVGRTSLVVAHRLSTVRSADCILLMRDGTIAERGGHDELMAAGGLYADLYNSQFAR